MDTLPPAIQVKRVPPSAAEVATAPDKFATVGEFALQALTSLRVLRSAGYSAAGGLSEQLAEAPFAFAGAVIGLVDKFPGTAKRGFIKVLPLSELELALLRGPRVHHAAVLGALTTRLVEWIDRSPIFVDEASVDINDFLLALRPHLDRWVDRQDVTELVNDRLMYR